MVNKTQEALKMAIKVLESNKPTHYYCDDTWYSCPKHEEGCANADVGEECNCGADRQIAEFDKAIKACKEALKPHPKCDEACMFQCQMERKEALAELALERMAQNAKELGLDYCSHGSDSACKECYMEKAK